MLFEDDILQLVEVNSLGNVTKYNTTFLAGLNQYISKMVDFKSYAFEDFQAEFLGYRFINRRANESDLQKDAHFIY